MERITLYNFALDGLANYKNAIILHQLFLKGLLVKEADNLSLMTKSFRNFVLTKESSAEIADVSRKGKLSTNIIRIIFYITVTAVAIFIFISQESTANRLITIVTALATLSPEVLKIFDKKIFASTDTKSES